MNREVRTVRGFVTMFLNLCPRFPTQCPEFVVRHVFCSNTILATKNILDEGRIVVSPNPFYRTRPNFNRHYCG